MVTTAGQDKRGRRRWVIWSAVILATGAALVAAIAVPIVWLLPQAEPYRTAVERLKQNPDAISELGTPISAGFPWGRISFENDSGSAALTFAATGPKGSGTVSLDARRDLGAWRLIRLELAIDGREDRIDLGADTRRLAPLTLPKLE